MTDRKRNAPDGLDESLRRLGGILGSPSLVLSYGHTTPLLERAWLRRAGLNAEEAARFMELLCLHGCMDEGARAVIERASREKGVAPGRAARMLLAGDGWPEEDDT